MYPAAKMAISLSKKTSYNDNDNDGDQEFDDPESSNGPFLWKQRFLLEHSYPITCCSIDSNLKYFVTGDSIMTPKNPITPEPSRVVIWDILESIAIASIEIPLSAATGDNIK